MSPSKTTNVIFLFFAIAMIENVNSHEREHDMQFLVDMIDQLNHSNKILTYLCWKRGDLVALSKAFSRKFIFHSSMGDFYSNKYNIYKGKIVFVLNMSCEGSFGRLTKSLESNLFDSAIWIIFSKLQEIKLHNFYFPINSLVYIIQKKGCLHFSVKTIYKINIADSEYLEADIAEWKSNKEFQYYNKFSLSENRTDLMRSPIRVSYVLTDNDTLNHIWDYRNINIDKLTKANYPIISHLMELINASKIDIWTNSWGHRNEATKIFDGMYGDLMFNRADLAGTAGLMQVARMEHFTFIPPVSPTAVLFIFHAPSLSYTANIFTLSFTTTVWVTFFSVILFSSVIIYITVILERRNNTDNSKIRKPSVIDVVFLGCSLLAQRGSYLEPNTFTGKIVLFQITLLCMYMYTGFSAYILVLLQSTSESITDLASLYESKLEMGIHNISYNRYYFTTPNDHSNETYRKLILENRVIPKNNWFSATDGLEKVRRGYFAFHMEAGTAFSMIKETFTENDKCKVRTVQTIFDSNDLSIAVPRNSVYRELFLIGFRRISEIGLQRREQLKFYAPKPQCIGRHGNYDSVRLVDCYFPFLIFGIGFLISCVIFVSEILIG